MHVYRALRAVTLGLRAAEVKLLKLIDKTSAAADTLGSTAKNAAHAALQRQEDKAFNKLLKVKSDTEVSIEALLQIEDNAHFDYDTAIDTADAHRQRIASEVL